MTLTTPAYSVRARIDVLPPSVNHMYKSTHRGGKALTDEALTFRWLVKEALMGKPTPPAGEPLELSIWLTFPTGRRADADNRIKALQDACALALDFDDVQIRALHVYAERGRLAETELLLETRDPAAAREGRRV